MVIFLDMCSHVFNLLSLQLCNGCVGHMLDFGVKSYVVLGNALKVICCTLRQIIQLAMFERGI